MALTIEERKKRERQRVSDDIEDILLKAAPAAAKKLAKSIVENQPLGREELQSITLILERTLGKTGTVKAPDIEADKTNELLARIAEIRQAEAGAIQDGDEDLVASGDGV